MRLKRILQISPFVIVLLVGVYLLRFLGNQHRHIDTAGDIVYATIDSGSKKSHIFIVHSDGTGLKQLTSGNSDDTDPCFSPDGSQIAYVSDKSGEPEVYVADADGRQPRAITLGNGSKSGPQFAPDGVHLGYIAAGKLLTTDLNTGQSELILPSNVNVASTTTDKLSAALRQPVVGFKWSRPSDPNQSEIAAVQEDPDSNLQTVALVPTNGDKPIALAGGATMSFDWSSDGQYLAAAMLGGQGGPGGRAFSGIVIFKSDGTIVPQAPIASVPTASDGPQNPSYSSDGSRIAFEVVQQTSVGVLAPRGIAVTPTTPGGQVQVIVQGAGRHPVFSPDGASMLFLAPDATSPADSDVYIFNLAAGSVTKVASGLGSISTASWSPSLVKGK